MCIVSVCVSGLCNLLACVICLVLFFFCEQKTAYELRISDWSSDVCSSDLVNKTDHRPFDHQQSRRIGAACADAADRPRSAGGRCTALRPDAWMLRDRRGHRRVLRIAAEKQARGRNIGHRRGGHPGPCRSAEHTSELQSLMRISYAVFCLKKKKQNNMYIYTVKHNQ